VRGALDRFAAPIGVAFQLRDDVLGAFGDPRETGKPIGSDIRARKRTALITRALETCGSDRERLERLFAAGTPSNADVEWALAVIERSGARDAIEARISELLSRARAALESAALHPEGRELLFALAGTLAERRA
jgi:geranylgeranyl diphosphate synthase type I